MFLTLFLADTDAPRAIRAEATSILPYNAALCKAVSAPCTPGITVNFCCCNVGMQFQGEPGLHGVLFGPTAKVPLPTVGPIFARLCRTLTNRGSNFRLSLTVPGQKCMLVTLNESLSATSILVEEHISKTLRVRA